MGSTMKFWRNGGASIGLLSVLELVLRYEADKMEAHRVDPRIGNARNDEPALMHALGVPAKPALGVAAIAMLSTNGTKEPFQSNAPHMRAAVL
jgi:hypothetical protein